MTVITPAAGSTTLEMVRLPAASFLMGDRWGDGFPQEHPVREVCVEGFWISRCCVTAGQYHEFAVAVDSGFEETWCDFINPCFIFNDGEDYRVWDGADRYPMIQVNFSGAAAYCNWRSRREGLAPVYDLRTLDADLSRNGYRLPTEAEWEYACGGPERFKYGFADQFQADLFCHQGYQGEHHRRRASWDRIGGFGLHEWSPMPVGTLPANSFGLHEMLGNVNEWCHDHYVAQPSDTGNGGGAPRKSSFRVIRGGSFLDGADRLRTTYRHAIHHQSKCMIDGFRIARTA